MNEEEIHELVNETRRLTIREVRREFEKLHENMLHDVGVGDVEEMLDRMEKES